MSKKVEDILRNFNQEVESYPYSEKTKSVLLNIGKILAKKANNRSNTNQQDLLAEETIERTTKGLRDVEISGDIEDLNSLLNSKLSPEELTKIKQAIQKLQEQFISGLGEIEDKEEGIRDHQVERLNKSAPVQLLQETLKDIEGFVEKIDSKIKIYRAEEEVISAMKSSMYKGNNILETPYNTTNKLGTRTR